MKKRILTEINRNREIMGLGVLLEQDANPDDYKKYAGGKPYELFLLKATPTSKLYMESDGGETTGAKIFKYRKRNPSLVRVEAIKLKIDGLDKDENKYDKRVEIFTNLINKEKKKYAESLSKKYFDEKYRYTNDKDNFKKAKRSDNPYEVNPEWVEGSKKVKVDIPLTPNERFEAMEDINDYIEKYYKGDYEAASKTKKLSKRTSYSRYYGVEKIILSPKDIKIVEEKPPVAEFMPGLAYTSSLTENGTNDVFVNNSWEVGKQIIAFAEGVVKQALAMKQQYEKKGYPNVKIEMTTKGKDEGGGDIEVPFTISTSASRIPNGGQAKDMTFLQLSEKRAESTFNYLKEVWGAAGIELIQPVINFQGDGKKNKDGSTGGASGPEWTGKDADRPNYDEHKYCNINCLFMFSSEGFTNLKGPLEPEVTKIGEWDLQVKRFTKGRPWKLSLTFISDGLKSIRLPKINWPSGVKYKKMPCAAYD